MSIYSEHFETVFSIKQNIQALRNKVLELAVQGKLVEQDTSDETASELLKRIQAEKVQLINENRIKKEKSLSEIENDEIPFEIPSSWEWVRLGDILFYTDSGKSPNCIKKKVEGKEWGVLTTTAIQSNKFLSEENKVLPSSFEVNTKMQVLVGDVLITRAGPINRTGIVCIVPDIEKNLILSDKIVRLNMTNSVILKTFVSQVMNSHFVRNQVFGLATGMDKQQVNLSQDKIKKIIIPIPPLAEQKRIALKVASVMSEIDHLEKYLERKERLEATLPKAVVSAIISCQNEEELKAQLGLVVEHFAEVFQTPESLQELRNVILQLGIQGKLVAQNLGDEPACELLKNIQVEKELLIKEKKIKREKALPVIKDDEIPFEIPSSWEWARLDTLTSLITKGTTPRGGRMAYIDNGIKFYRAENVNKVLSVNETKYVSLDIHESFLSRSILQENDLLITIAGTLGRSAIVKKENLPGNVNQAISIIRFVSPSFVNLDYFNYYFSSALVNHMLLSKTKVTAIPNLTLEIITNTLVSIPPLAEQQRIVNKIESLFAVIDKLEKEMNREQRLVKAMATI